MGSEAMQDTQVPLTGRAPGAPACGGPPGLDMPAAAALYEIVVAHGGRGEIAAISTESGLDADRAAAGWRTLADLALVRISGGRAETLGSDAALDAVVGRYASYAFEALRSVRAVNDTTRKLLAVFGSGASDPGGAPAVLPFSGAAYAPYDDDRRALDADHPDAAHATHNSPEPAAADPRQPTVARESDGERAPEPAPAPAVAPTGEPAPGSSPEPAPGSSPEPAVEPYAGARGRERVLRALTQSTTVSADCLHKGALPGDPAVLDAYLEMTVRLVRRGVRVRALCTPSMLRAPGGTRYARHVVAAGAQVRVVDRVGHDMLICDGRTVCLPDTACGDPGDPAVLRITSPRLARTFLVVYEAYWRRAVPYTPRDARRVRPAGGDGPDGGGRAAAGEQDVDDRPDPAAPPLGSFEQAVVRLMAAGRGDDAIARELGVEPGAVADVMASLMRRLGAANRFEAGIRLAGTLDRGTLP